VNRQLLDSQLLEDPLEDALVHQSGEPIQASEPVAFNDSSRPIRSRKRKQVGGGYQAPKVRAPRRKKQKRLERFTCFICLLLPI
jgi:hypothetical protein